MPLKYPNPVSLVAGPQGVEVHVVRTMIDTPRGQPGSVTYHYEAVDAAGRVVHQTAVTVALDTLKAEKPTDFAAVYVPIKKDAYERAQKVYPAGLVT